MSSATYIARLRKEFRDLKKNPVNNIQATPKENNILEWHYVIQGLKGSPYQDGWYHGVVTFPKEYPFKPPSIQMITPNGRFKVDLHRQDESRHDLYQLIAAILKRVPPQQRELLDIYSTLCCKYPIQYRCQ